MSFSEMKRLTRATIVFASPTSDSGVPWDCPSLASTRATVARRPSPTSGGRGQHARDVCHPSGGVTAVHLLRQRRLREQQEDAGGDVLAVGAGILLEWLGVLGEPDVARQLVAEDLEVDLPVAGEFRVVDLF